MAGGPLGFENQHASFGVVASNTNDFMAGGRGDVRFINPEPSDLEPAASFCGDSSDLFHREKRSDGGACDSSPLEWVGVGSRGSLNGAQCLAGV